MASFLGMKYNCGNTKNGCQEVLTETALEDHEAECIYRLVPCILKNALWVSYKKCNGKVTFRDVIQHYEDHEKVTLEEWEELDLKIKHPITWPDLSGRNCYEDPMKITLNNQTFLLAEKTEDKIMYKWVYILGSLNEAKHFTFKLALFGTKVTTTFEGPVSAIDESFDALFKAGKCFSIPHNNFIAQIVNVNNEYYCSLEIRNLKEEVKDENYESGISDSEEDTKK